MTPNRKGAVVRRVRDIAVGSTLSLAVLAGVPLLQSCGGSNESEYETVTRKETAFSKGVKTYITETAPGTFKITDEVPAPADSAVAIVRYYDGHRDTLNAASAKALIDTEITTNQAQVGHHNSLGNALLYGGMGYWLASSMQNRQYASYRNQANGARFYNNPSVYDRSQNVTRQINASRTTRTITTTRPASGRSGFFSGRSSGRSFGS